MYTNLVNVQIIISLLKQYGIRHVVLSPGTRNVPFVHSVETDDFFKCYSIVDERSAAYFALGLSEALNKPVCVSCTSSTATCNYMPAVKEAYEQGVELIVLSADRDFRYLYQMEDQMIDQVNMYNGYVKYAANLPIVRDYDDRWYCERQVNSALLEMSHGRKGPIQINFQVNNVHKYTVKSLPVYRKITKYIAFDEESTHELIQELSSKKRILVLCGQYSDSTKNLSEKLKVFFQHYNVAVSGDYFANLSGDELLRTVLVTETMENEEFEEFVPDLVISFGTHLWSYIKSKLRYYHGKFEHWSINPAGRVEDGFKSMTKLFEMDPEDFFDHVNMCPQENLNDKKYYNLWEKKINKVVFPDLGFSNFSAIRDLVEYLPANSLLHLSVLNSIRLTQYCQSNYPIRCFGNLGADGIDGAVSTFLGQSSSHDGLSFLISGDLSFLYDMNGMLIELNKNNRFFVINNHAGAEFHKNFDINKIPMVDQHIAAAHKTDIKFFADDLDVTYLSARNSSELSESLKTFCAPSEKPILLEVFTDAETDAKLLLKFYAMNKDNNFKFKAKKYYRALKRKVKL